MHASIFSQWTLLGELSDGLYRENVEKFFMNSAIAGDQILEKVLRFCNYIHMTYGQLAII